MLIVTFNPWVVTETTATASWIVTDSFGEGVQSVEVAILKEGGTPEFVTATGNEASIEVPQFDGVVRCVVRATTLTGEVTERDDETGVLNYDAPTAPEGLSFKNLSNHSVTIRWVADIIGPENTDWAILNTLADDSEVVLATVPRATRETVVVTETVNLHHVTVRGVDQFGNFGPDSPALSFAQDPQGPIVLLGDWSVTGVGASIGWDVVSDEFLQSVTWSLTLVGQERVGGVMVPVSRVTTGQSLSSDTIALTASAFQGTLTLHLTAVDAQFRTTTVTSVTPLYTIAPDKPRLEVVEIGVTFIKVRLIPAPDAAAATHTAQIRMGTENEVEITSPPFIATFTGLAPGTRYVFTGRAIGQGYQASAFAPVMAASTIADPNPVPGEPPTYDGGPVMPFIAARLTAEMREYVLQTTADTKVRLRLPAQHLTPTTGFDAVVDFIRAIGPQFGEAVRREFESHEAYKASVLIDKTQDPLGKLAILCELIHFGFIWNEGN